MKTITFLAITLISGAIAGTILGVINQGIVEPYIERAIALENENAAKEGGEMIDPIQFNNYRIWQKGGEIFAGTVYGTSLAALFGVVYAYARGSLPGATNNNVRKALILAVIMWFVLFVVPALKYPGNPPAVGNPDTLLVRQTMYIAFLALSGFSALVLAYLYRKLGKNQSKKIIIPLTYAGIMIAAYIAMPPNPDPINAPMDLVIGFRIVSGLTVSMFWGIMAVIFGSFWNKFKPHETAKITI